MKNPINKSHAPYPRYIIWSNLSRKGAYWYLYWFIINSILLLITIFLTTPSFIVQTIENLNITNPLEHLIEEKSPILASYIPTFMLWTFSGRADLYFIEISVNFNVVYHLLNTYVPELAF